MNSLLRIVVGEQEFNSDLSNTYKWIEEFLWKEGFPGLTIRRGELNLDYNSRMRSIALEDIQFNNLAIILETVVDSNKIEKVREEIIKNIPHGQVSVINGTEDKDMEEHEYFMVKIYTKEDNLLFKKEGYERILEFLQKKNVIWATVTKGLIGYGKSGVIYKRKIFSVSEKMPIVIECVVSGKNLKELLNQLKNIVEEGAIFTAPIDLIANK